MIWDSGAAEGFCKFPGVIIGCVEGGEVVVPSCGFVVIDKFFDYLALLVEKLLGGCGTI